MFSIHMKELTIKKKIYAFMAFDFVIIIIAFSLSFLTIKFSLFDFREILDTNDVTNQLIVCLKQETEAFEAFMKNEKDENREQLLRTIDNTNKAIKALPCDYSQMGEERYARTQAISRAYSVYSACRNRCMTSEQVRPRDLDLLYKVYDMQDYLRKYANQLMNMTITEGNVDYQSKIPIIKVMPYAIGLVGVLLMAIMVYLSRSLNRSIVSPMLSLAEAAGKIAENDFYIDDVEVINEDEIGELVHAFNKMKYATGEYISALEGQRETLDLLHASEMEQLEMEKKLEAIRFEALKNQIQPHFLFNTLNVIAGMANLEDAHTTEKMIQALSNLFRYNLKTTDVHVVLTKEIKVLEDYMYLQLMRFGSRITYEIKCDINPNGVMVPAFIFQPLAENAIIHGIAPKETGGKILVHIWKEKDTLSLAVSDTGVGMNEAKLKALINSLTQDETETKGIGLKNVYQRVKKLYPDSDFEVCSKEGEGTTICIRIPFSKTGMTEGIFFDNECGNNEEQNVNDQNFSG